jgi:hypothetical protein
MTKHPRYSISNRSAAGNDMSLGVAMITTRSSRCLRRRRWTASDETPIRSIHGRRSTLLAMLLDEAISIAKRCNDVEGRE